MINLKNLYNHFFYKKFKYSQAGQDIFANELFGNFGTYIDVGAGDPLKGNNTYFLEVEKKWKGFSVDYGDSDKEQILKLKNLWAKHPERKNKIYWNDALKFNYRDKLDENGLDIDIDFLSCDIDPQENTFLALKKVILDGVRPKYISFETDFYREKINYSELAFNFLKPYGYKIAVKNVFSNYKKNKIFETWFIKNTIKFYTIDYFDWLKK